MCWCLLWCLVFALRFPCSCCVHMQGFNHWGLQHCNPLEFTLGRYICLQVMVHGPCKECTDWPFLPHSQLSPAIPLIWCCIQLEGAWQSHPISLTSLHGGERPFFSGSAAPNDVVDPKSEAGVKIGDYYVVIRNQVYEFTHTWLAEHFITQSPMYPGFMGKVSTLTHFPLELGCEDCSFLDQSVEDFEHGLDSILTDSVNTLEPDASLDDVDAISFLVSSGFFTQCCFIYF